MRAQKPIDDQSINNRLRRLQEQKREIAEMAAKYDLEDNSKIETYSLLTLVNPRMGHHHGPKFGQGAANGPVLENQDRKARLAEYHRITNERRKHINAKVQKKKADEQLQVEA